MRLAGRPTESRTQGGGGREHLPRLHLFAGFPYEPRRLTTGVATEKPFYCYEGESLVIRGECYAGPIAAALAAEGLHPVLGARGEAMAAVWINRLDDSVAGAYHEIVIALDAAREAGTRAACRGTGPYAYLHPFFGGPTIQLLHTLYISSPLSIAWGREMQAFPKHPRPAAIAITREDRGWSVDCRWGEHLLVAGRIHERWGATAFVRQALGISWSMGPSRVTRFLAASIVRFPVRMPATTRAAYQAASEHTGHLLKGRGPCAVRAWPWRESDRLELGTGLDSQAEPGRESATDLLARAGFRPRVVTHIPSLQLVVTDG